MKAIDVFSFMEPKKQERLIDVISESRLWLMGLATLSVMLFHQHFVAGEPFLFFRRAGHWGVDVFLFLSGFGIWRSLITNKQGGVIAFYKRRLWRILPYSIAAGWIWDAVMLVVPYQCSGEYAGKAELALSAMGIGRWYIRSILAMYLLSPLMVKGLVRALSRGAWALLVWGLSWLAGGFLLVYLFQSLYSGASLAGNSLVRDVSFCIYAFLYGTNERFPSYLLGMLVAAYGSTGHWKKLFAGYILLSSFCIGLLLTRVYGCLGRGGIGAIVAWQPYLILSLAIPAICGILGRLRLLMPPRALRAVMWLGRYSLEIYVLHECLFYMVAYVVRLPGWLMLPVSMLLSFGAAWALRKSVDAVLAKSGLRHSS